jgi:Fe-S oxidoreductase
MGVYFFHTNFVAMFCKKRMGYFTEREVPLLAPQTLKWLTDPHQPKELSTKENCIYFAMITNYYDVQVGIDAYELLSKLGTSLIVNHEESGRAFISSFLEEAKLIAVKSTLHLLLMIIVRYRIRTFGNLL